MKAQDYILIFVVISFQTAPISADIFETLNPLKWDSSQSVDISESLQSDIDFSSYEISESEDYTNSIYGYTVQNLDGQDVCLNEYSGQVLIIVNYASTCGFTYENVCALSEMSKKYKDQGLTILIFPSNDFFENIGGNTAAKELAKCHPEFEVFSEICVNGESQHPMYRFLKKKLPGFLSTEAIKWNFTKFVVNRHGYPVQRYSATDSFDAIEETVQELLTDKCSC
ncbi:probable phospholipid hydroperoxide glutathione peroxidase [Melanaphis sacchari]|nr:probable phospholipid hydroperoxide glutathione peroxidase [Melanaphis sacchari]